MGREGHAVFAWAYARIAPRQDARGTAERRRRLLSVAMGSVVEVGAGTGLNLRYYPPTVTEVLALEPDPHMFRRLADAVPTASVPVSVERAPAEPLELADGSIDTVVMSLVLCSVPDPGAALAEARRVLVPAGRLLFFEHVRSSDDRLARRQDRFERPWGWVSGGCHPNRDTVAAIESAGFRIETIDRWDDAGALLAEPHVLGWATSP
jgi:SAM-dependent methyltransferase